MKVTKEDAIAVMDERSFILKLDPDSFHDKMAGYLTALYDLGFLSWNDVRGYEESFGVIVFPEED